MLETPMSPFSINTPINNDTKFYLESDKFKSHSSTQSSPTQSCTSPFNEYNSNMYSSPNEAYVKMPRKMSFSSDEETNGNTLKKQKIENNM